VNLLLLPVQTLKNNKILLALCTKSDHTIKYDFVHLRMEIITETTGDLFYRIKEKQTASRQDTYGSACHRQSLRQRFFRIYDKRFHVRRKYAVQLAAYADAWDKRCCGLWCVGYHYGAGNRDELKNFFRKSIRIILTMSVVLTIAAELLARPLSMIFVSYNAELLEMTVYAFAVYSFSFLLSGVNIYASAFFTALNDGFTSAMISFGRTLVFQVVSVLILPILFGAYGISI